MDETTSKPDGTDPKGRAPGPGFKLALELGPLLVFFFANARGARLMETVPALAVFGKTIFLATGLFMAATALSLGLSWVLARRLPLIPLVSGVIVLVFGTLTLWLNDETFIKMKPTVVNGLFAAVLLGGLVFGRSILGYVFAEAFSLDKQGWRKLTLRWGLFFIVLAGLNEIVWRNFSTDFWVAFKVWGIMPLTVLFTLSQMPLILRHAIPQASESPR